MGVFSRIKAATRDFFNVHKTPLYIALALALAATFVNPFSREIQVLMFRLYFNLSGDVVIQGQPAGGLFFPIPNVRFSDEYSKKLAALPAKTPDDCLLKDCLGGGFRRDASENRQPPSADWRGHPLQEWTALRCSLDMGDYVPCEFRSSPAIQYCATLVEDALAANPQNGAMILAKAKLRFLTGDIEGAKRGWTDASRAEIWSKGDLDLKSYLGGLFRKAGLPAVEAAEMATSRTFFLEDSFREPLEGMLIDAVKADDDRAQTETGELMRSLYQSLRLKAPGSWRNAREPFKARALIGAIAGKDPDVPLGCDPCDGSKGPVCVEKQDLAVREYFDAHMGKDVYDQVVAELAALRKDSKAGDERDFRRMLLWQFISSLAAIVLMAWQFIVFWLELLVVLYRRFDLAGPRKVGLRLGRFYAFFLPALAVLGFGAARWKHVLDRTLDKGSGTPSESLIHPVVDDALIATTLLAALFFILTFFSNSKKKNFDHAEPMFAIASYVLIAAVAGYCRYRVFLTL